MADAVEDPTKTGAFAWLKEWNKKRKVTPAATPTPVPSPTPDPYDQLSKSFGGTQSQSKADAIKALKDAEKD